MHTTQEHFVLFADMLGFKRLVLEHKVPYPENLEFRGRLFERPQRPNPSAATGNALSRAFRAFHSTVHDTLDSNHWHAQPSLIVFSDSLFLASHEPADCLNFAQYMMLNALNLETPLRMGIGLGTFVRYGFSYEDNPQVAYVSSQFFGSGVVNALEAEKCLKGMRIAVHPSAAAALTHLPQGKILPLPAEQAGLHASHELNYLRNYPGPMSILGVDKSVGDSITKLAASAPAVPEVQVHYSESIAAIERMVDAWNQAPVYERGHFDGLSGWRNGA